MRKLILGITSALLTAAVGVASVKIHALWQSRTVAVATKQESGFATLITETNLSCKRPELPIPVKALLDRNFPGWKFPAVSDETCQTIKQLAGPDAYPELIQGDFDSDGKPDYAVLFERGSSSRYIAAFLKRRDQYKMTIVSHQGGESLQLMRRGASDYDYDAQREFTYSRDTIFSGMGMGGSSYLYENGKFRAIITSD
jgi:hypothetical protein